MKFLFDQSADFRLISHLRELGHDIEAVARNYPPGLADAGVLAIARQEQRILVVAKRDFGELIFHQQLVHAGVIFFDSQAPTFKPRSKTSIPCWTNTLRRWSTGSSWW